MSFLQSTRKISSGSLLLFIVLLATTMQVSAAGYSQARGYTSYRQGAAHLNSQVGFVAQHVGRSSQLAPTVHVLDSLGGTTILQFSLVPSGIKALFPNATGLVTIVRGDRTNSSSDVATIDVQKMPPNITFTIFLIELANKPFGHVEYVADLTTRGDGSGEAIFHVITLVAFAVDARNPNSSQDDKEGLTSGTNLEHLGMWFSSLADAQTVLNDGTLKGTIFDGGNPPLHAGPQAMTDGQTAPVF